MPRIGRTRKLFLIFGSEEHKDWTLSLYNAVNGTAYANPEDFLIRPYLEANRVEVKKMLLTEYNETRTMEMFKKEGREEGREEGRIEGRKEGHKEGRKEGRIEGRAEGRIEGRGEGEARLGALITKLRELGRVDDAFRAASDPAFRSKLYAEFSMV